jgi:hypothetical protein
MYQAQVIWNVSQSGVLYNKYILSNNSFHITVLTL